MVRQQIEKSGDLILLEKLRVPERRQVFKVWEDRFDNVYLKSCVRSEDLTARRFGFYPRNAPSERLMGRKNRSKKITFRRNVSCDTTIWDAPNDFYCRLF